MRPEEITTKIAATLPEAKVQCQDLTGTGDHWRVTIVAPQFEGKGMLEQHRMVHAILHDSMEAEGGGIHALSLQTYSPAEWTQKKG